MHGMKIKVMQFVFSILHWYVRTRIVTTELKRFESPFCFNSYASTYSLSLYGRVLIVDCFVKLLYRCYYCATFLTCQLVIYPVC